MAPHATTSVGRPEAVALHPDGPGFPSGHTSSGFYAATALADRASAPRLYAFAALVALARLHRASTAPATSPWER